MKPPVKKEIKPLDKDDVAKTVNTIVSLMENIDSSRELISDKLSYLKSTYGLSSTDVRAAATAIKKQSVEELDEKTKRVQDIIDMCL
jgi:hypothetical protein